MPRDFDSKLEVIRKCRNSGFSIGHELLHAFVACLTKEELCEAIERTINDPVEVRQPFMNRLLRVLGEGPWAKVDELAEHLLAVEPSDAYSRTRVDAALSRLYHHLPPNTRTEIIERWKARGTKAAAARWLKAVADDPMLLDLSDVRDYWRSTLDPSAAKLLAYKGDSAFLKPLVPELIDKCDEGWIISRAILTAGAIDEDAMAVLRSKFPATYAYICAKTGRQLQKEDAIAIVRDASDQGFEGQRGLAIWSLGHLGMWEVLEEIAMLASDIDDRHFAARLG